MVTQDMKDNNGPCLMTDWFTCNNLSCAHLGLGVVFLLVAELLLHNIHDGCHCLWR